MTLFGGTLTNIAWVNQGNLTATSSSALIAVTFTPDAVDSTLVLAWGGHIASRTDWGFTNGVPNSAGGIQGSPYHMSFDSWSSPTFDMGNIGAQDRSLSAKAVFNPTSNQHRFTET